MDESGAIIDELLNNAPGAEVVALIKEKQPGLVSVSLRTTVDEVDASQIAGLFGGGGHKRAAGCRIKGVEFEEGVEQVVQAIRAVQSQRHGIEGENEASVPTNDETSPKNPYIKIQDSFQE